MKLKRYSKHAARGSSRNLNLELQLPSEPSALCSSGLGKLEVVTPDAEMATKIEQRSAGNVPKRRGGSVDQARDKAHCNPRYHIVTELADPDLAHPERRLRLPTAVPEYEVGPRSQQRHRDPLVPFHPWRLPLHSHPTPPLPAPGHVCAARLPVQTERFMHLASRHRRGYGSLAVTGQRQMKLLIALYS